MGSSRLKRCGAHLRNAGPSPSGQGTITLNWGFLNSVPSRAEGVFPVLGDPCVNLVTAKRKRGRGFFQARTGASGLEGAIYVEVEDDFR